MAKGLPGLASNPLGETPDPDFEGRRRKEAEAAEESELKLFLENAWCEVQWPLSVAVCWIATGGDARLLDNFETLEGAAKQLLNALKTGQIEAYGVALNSELGLPEPVPKTDFTVAQPFVSDVPLEMIFAKVPILEWRALVESNWRLNDGDRISTWEKAIWRRLSVRKADILTLWPVREPSLLEACQRVLADGVTAQKPAWKAVKASGIMCPFRKFLPVWKSIAGTPKPGPKGPRSNYPKGRDNSG